MKRNFKTSASERRKVERVVRSKALREALFRDARMRAVPAPLPVYTGKEIKFVDVAAANYPADTTGSVTLLNGVAQGDDYSSRQGRQVVFTSVSVKGILQPVDATTGPCFCRLIIVWDNANNGGAAPAITDLLVAATSLSHANLNNRQRFKVLLDEQHAIGGQDNTATQAYSQAPAVVTINRYVKIPNAVTTFSGTGGTSASIQQGAIYMFTIGNQAANVGGQFSVATRVRFTDA